MKITFIHTYTYKHQVNECRLQQFPPIIPFDHLFFQLLNVCVCVLLCVRTSKKDTEAVRSSSNLLSGKSGTFNVKNNNKRNNRNTLMLVEWFMLIYAFHAHRFIILPAIIDEKQQHTIIYSSIFRSCFNLFFFLSFFRFFFIQSFHLHIIERCHDDVMISTALMCLYHIDI